MRDGGWAMWMRLEGAMGYRVLASSFLFCIVSIVMLTAQSTPAPVTIRAARVLDGRGKILTDAVVEIQGSKITKIDQRNGPVTYDLGQATVLPGMIDVHVHLNWYFGPSGKYGDRGPA